MQRGLFSQKVKTYGVTHLFAYIQNGYNLVPAACRQPNWALRVGTQNNPQAQHIAGFNDKFFPFRIPYAIAY